MEKLRQKLYQAIDKYGLTDKRTVAISQELNEIVCEKQQKLIKGI